ncbi:hypothetical protein OO012_11025 [Rhodobacteraceae bacterium KMM 6894]|nr:hypothetical protein [Rhodobacteraceae bacterium KMM 6894]
MNWAVVIAAMVTLFGGALVYRWQKETDRLSEIAKERRDAYRDFIDAIDQHALVFFSDDEEAKKLGFSQLRTAKRKLILVASSWVLKSVENHARALHECELVMDGVKVGSSREAIDQIHVAEDAIIKAMRDDFYYGVAVSLKDLFEIKRVKRPLS